MSCSERLRSGEQVRDWWWVWSRPAAETVAMTTGGLRATEEADRISGCGHLLMTAGLGGHGSHDAPPGGRLAVKP